MSEGMWIGGMSVWLVCTIALMVLMIKFVRHAQKKHPEQYAKMIDRSKRNARWVGRTYLVNPARDLWEDR